MIITYHGAQHVKLSLGDLTIAYNPVSKSSKSKVTKYGANIALSSLDSDLYNGVGEVVHGSKEPFTVTGPGEYETQGVFIKGVGVETDFGGSKKINTIYTFTLDNMKVCLLGSLSKKLTAHERELIDTVDIVFAADYQACGGLSTFDIYQTAQSLNPKIIIPVGFDEKSLPLFLKEGGADKREYIEKLTIKRKDIDMKNGEVVPLMEV